MYLDYTTYPHIVYLVSDIFLVYKEENPSNFVLRERNKKRKIGKQVQYMYHETKRKLLKRKKGGLVTVPFIIANEAFEKVASYGLVP